MNELLTMPYAPDDAWWPEYAPDEILPRLWQGGTEDDDVVGCPTPDGHYSRCHPFDLVVTLFGDAQPVPWEVEELRFGFPDSNLTPRAIERAVALSAHAYARWQSGARVLIRCQAGVNRSGLVMALTLMRHGLSATDAIGLIREGRGPAVLSNRHFVRWLVDEAHRHVSVDPSDSPSSNNAPSSNDAPSSNLNVPAISTAA